MAIVRNRRLFWNGVLLCIPAVVIVGGISYFLYDKVPEIAANEHRRVVAEYRLVAEDIKNGEIPKKDLIVEQVRRPKTARKMKPGRWDYEPCGDGQLVWYAAKGGSKAVIVPKIEEFDYATLIYTLGGIFMVLFTAITAFGVRYFWMFARERDDFLSATAHDLTTPLVGMRYAIGRDDDNARCLNERMLRIVENIRDFLKLGGKRRQPQMAAVDVSNAFKEAYSIFREDYRDIFDGEDVEVVYENCEEGGVVALADSTMLVQILWNLLGNDLKYAAAYGRVMVRFSKSDGRVRVEFIDEGQGMTRRQMKKAFDRYYRSRTVLESGKGGFGIGLCTAREFAEAMGGALSVKANYPKGCIFTLVLPSA
jgi:signal transduction histidine kinase